jgi:hypothetical protein
VGLEQGPLNLVSRVELHGRKNSDSSTENENTAMGIHCAGHVTSLSTKVGTNFADRWGVAQPV